MTNILFICHGNICRSPMAEFVFRDMLEKRGIADKFLIASAATSTEEIGNRVHPGTQAVLARCGISTDGKTAVQMTKQDADDYDYLIGMDCYNIKNIRRIAGEENSSKIYRLLDFTGMPRDIADPWYTGDFQSTYDDVMRGCQALLKHILRFPIHIFRNP